MISDQQMFRSHFIFSMSQPLKRIFSWTYFFLFCHKSELFLYFTTATDGSKGTLESPCLLAMAHHHTMHERANSLKKKVEKPKKLPHFEYFALDYTFRISKHYHNVNNQKISHNFWGEIVCGFRCQYLAHSNEMRMRHSFAHKQMFSK